MTMIKWYVIVCNTCGNGEQFQGTKIQAEMQYKKTGGIIINGKGKRMHYCDSHCKPKKAKAESCGHCGRDLPDSEICEYCGYDSHQKQLGGGKNRKIKREIEFARLEREPV